MLDSALCVFHRGFLAVSNPIGPKQVVQTPTQYGNTSMNKLSRALMTATALFTIPLVLGGCKGISQIRQLRPDGLATPFADYLPIQGQVITGDRRIAIDVENLNGSVTILVSDRYKQAMVYAHARWRGGLSKDEWEVVKNEDWVVAEHVIEGDNSILRVLSQATPETDMPVRTELRILLPSCDGVYVRNAGGLVTVVGAGGAHTIVSGFEIGSGGHIEVRTSRPIHDPVTLRTSDGHINLVLGPNSGGSLDIQSDSGRVAFGSKFGRVSQVRVEPLRWTGVWNGGTNPIVLQALSGNARVRVEAKPEMFSTGIQW
jgi:hypothetical protein